MVRVRNKTIKKFNLFKQVVPREDTKDDIISTFEVTKDHMLQAAKILGNEGKTENSGCPSA